LAGDIGRTETSESAEVAEAAGAAGLLASASRVEGTDFDVDAMLGEIEGAFSADTTLLVGDGGLEFVTAGAGPIAVDVGVEEVAVVDCLWFTMSHAAPAMSSTTTTQAPTRIAAMTGALDCTFLFRIVVDAVLTTGGKLIEGVVERGGDGSGAMGSCEPAERCAGNGAGRGVSFSRSSSS